MKMKAMAKKEFKKTMLAIWSESGTSNGDDDDDQATNLGLMAKEEQVQEEDIQCESLDKLDYSVFLELL